MYEASQSILRHILEGDTATSNDQKNFNKLKADYVACMDQSTIKAIGLDPLADIVQNVKALFPVSSENWKVSPIRSSKAQHGMSASANDLTTAVLLELNLGISPFISAGVGVSNFTCCIASLCLKRLPGAVYYVTDLRYRQMTSILRCRSSSSPHLGSSAYPARNTMTTNLQLPSTKLLLLKSWAPSIRTARRMLLVRATISASPPVRPVPSPNKW